MLPFSDDTTYVVPLHCKGTKCLAIVVGFDLDTRLTFDPETGFSCWKIVFDVGSHGSSIIIVVFSGSIKFEIVIIVYILYLLGCCGL